MHGIWCSVSVTELDLSFVNAHRPLALQDAHDWAVSRSRFWGTPIPIWVSKDGEEMVVIGSKQQLEELSGHKVWALHWNTSVRGSKRNLHAGQDETPLKPQVDDLHRHFIDHITIPSQQGKGELHRVDEVFDCWFESGSMPYAQQHYPFENQQFFQVRESFSTFAQTGRANVEPMPEMKAKLVQLAILKLFYIRSQDNFPADFVAEGLDQTRGWFYTLMVLSTALFNKPAFKNLVCNGLVLAEDGKKMSKRLQNYPVNALLRVNRHVCNGCTHFIKH